jgi:hypothetical protein
MDKGKLTLLFIRDDTTVRRFRMRPFWLKLVTYLFGFMVLLAVISSYGAYRFWTKYSKLLATHNQLELRHHEMQVELERLANLEKLRQSRDQTGKTETEGDAARPAPKPDVQPTVEPASRMTENQLAALYPPLDKEIIEVNNLAIKPFGNESLKVTFDIKNIDPKDRAISGRVNLALITWQGEKLPLEVNRSNLSFRIQWFKSMQTDFDLPQGETLKEVYALRVSIISKDSETILQETHPLSILMPKSGA